MKFDNAYIDDDCTLHLEKSTGEGSGYHLVVANDCMVELYSIPMYGGKERHEGYFNSIGEAVFTTEGWT